MSAKHWAIIVAIVASIGLQLTSLHDWSAITPTFVGGLLGLIASNVAALFTPAIGTPPPPPSAGSVPPSTVARLS
jgi:hypothetical protein